MRAKFVELAFGMTEAVARFVEKAKYFFYAVALWAHRCPSCNGRLAMAREGRCSCEACGQVMDPTVEFQRCATCGGQPVLQIRRYACRGCGQDITSRFTFDGMAFDAEYFREKMAEHRKRKEERRERVRQMLAESRSGTLDLPPAELEALPGLAECLSQLIASEPAPEPGRPRSEFDLKAYQAHIQAHIHDSPVSLDELPPLSENTKIDRVWRFIAIIFLAHAGLLHVWQDGPAIMVSKREADTEGQDIPGEFEAADGIQGPVGRVEA